VKLRKEWVGKEVTHGRKKKSKVVVGGILYGMKDKPEREGPMF